MLKNELGDLASYRDIISYPTPYSGAKAAFYMKFAFNIPSMLKTIKKEHEIVERMLSREKYHRIISDNRYGIYSKSVPSYLITHQLRFMAPKRIRFIENRTERFVSSKKDGFDRFIVPDDEEGTLSGELSHELRHIPRKKIFYSGPLSDFSRKETEEDIGLLVSISGPEPQRTIFERMIMNQQEHFPENTVITLGKSEDFRKERWKRARVYTYLSKADREDIMNRSRLVLSRSGYSTIMDLAVLGKKAMFVPTPGQTEQEYLSEYHMEKGTYFSIGQKEFSLETALERAKEYRGIRMDGDRSVERILNLVG